MKKWTKIFVLAVCTIFVFTMVQGCQEAAKTESKGLAAKPCTKTDMTKPCPKAAECTKPCPKATAMAGNISQEDIKKARLVSVENLELKTQVEQLQAKVDDLNAKLTKAQKENENLQKASEQGMELLLTSLGEESTKLQEENKQLKAQIEELKTK